MERLADILIINTAEDEKDASAFKAFIQEHSPDVEIWTLHQDVNDPLGILDSPEFKMDTVSQRGGEMFFFITKNFCENKFLNSYKNVLVYIYFKKDMLYKLRPVLAQPPKGSDSTKNYHIPFPLNPIFTIPLCRITKGENISKLTAEDMIQNDKQYYESITYQMGLYKPISG